ncbi:glycosyltransferase [Vibrio mediterranei]
MKNRIVITGDVFRRPKNGKGFIQDGNIQWVYDLFSFLLEDITGENVILDMTSYAESGFSAGDFYGNSNESCDYYKWVSNFNKCVFSDDEINYTKKCYHNDFIIGFELSNFQKKLFEACDIPFLNLAIHPARFGDDYYFKVDLNKNFDYGDYSQYLVKDSTIKKNALFYKAQNRRGNRLEVKGNSVLFCGQVEEDASLIDGNYMVDKDMYHKDIMELASQHEHLYYKPHPHSLNQKATFELIDRLPNASIINSPFYELISKDEIKTVAAISSGTLYEAELFGKSTVRLLDNEFNFHTNPILSIDGSIFTGEFFAKILSKHFAINECFDKSPVSFNSPIKDSLKVSWKSNPTNRSHDIFLLPKLIENEVLSGKKLHEYLRGSWAKESWGAWMLNQNQKIVFRTNNIKVGDSIHLNLKFVRKFRFKKHNTVKVRINNKDYITESTRDASLSLRVSIDSEMEKSQLIELSFCDCNYVVPSEISTSSDMRKLFLGVNSIELIKNKAESNCYTIDISSSDIDVLVDKSIGANKNLDIPVNIDSRSPLDTFVRIKYDAKNITKLIISVNGNSESKYVDGRGEFLLNIEPYINLERRVSLSILNSGNDEVSIKTIGFGTKYDYLSLDDGSRKGINVVGQHSINTGMGVACRSALTLMSSVAGASRVTPIQYNNSKHKPRIENKPSLQYSDQLKSGVDLFLLPSPQIDAFFKDTKHHIDFNNHKIIWGAWELAEIPSYLVQEHTFDEYWAMSGFIAEAVKKKTDKPVITVPLPVDFSYPLRLYERTHFGFEENEFIFLYNYCADSTIIRKNPLAAIRAFQEAFQEDQPVKLILKTKINQSQMQNVEEHEVIKRICREDNRITLLEGMFNLDEIKSLYLACDCYVSLHRSEGFGLTMAEAMGFGKPVIATGYSGNLEFMTNSNSCLVDYDLVKVKGNYHGQHEQYWAEPKVSQAASYMQRIYSDKPFRDSLSREGMYDVHKNLSYENVSKVINERIKELKLL